MARADEFRRDTDAALTPITAARCAEDIPRRAAAVSAAEADITHIDMGEERTGEAAELQLVISVRDRLHLAEVLRTP